MLRRTLILTLSFILLTSTASGVALSTGELSGDEDTDDDSSTIKDTVHDATKTLDDPAFLNANDCTVDREANHVSCPTPASIDADTPLPEACTLTGETLVCSLPSSENEREPPCQPSERPGALIECNVPPDCVDNTNERGCEIPSHCTLRGDRVLCAPLGPQKTQTEDPEDEETDQTLRPDCAPLSETTLACTPPPECQEQDHVNDRACKLPSSCNQTRTDRYHCTVRTVQDTQDNITRETPEEAQDRTHEDIRPQLVEHIQEHVQTYRANILEAQQAHHEHRQALQDRFDEAKDELRTTYTQCLSQTPENASDEDRHDHQRSCLQEARDNLHEERQALLEDHRNHKETLLETLENAKRATCNTLATTLTNALTQANLPRTALNEALSPTEVPVCSNLLLDALADDPTLEDPLDPDREVRIT